MSAGAIVLEPLREAHAVSLFPLLCDAELWAYTDDEPPESISALAERYRRLESRRSPDGLQRWLNWAIVTPEGVAGFVQATVADDVAEIAYVVGARFQSRGIARESVATMLEILRRDFGVATYRATVDARNIPSVRLLVRLRFSLVGTNDDRNMRYERAVRASSSS